ncbi:acetyl-CoA synthetase [Salsuginibacillus halophilus]|uniref:Acetyl-CoA synthetase n=1 Tax=Salsuginibacillus halophilus TaxID=517424 RepID=A0A2P8HYL0_9BACI|nr:acyl--CoA ligase [Salsuginibacillus halophilus]PSL51275.1 acetyl-CoA synthetase [Salsuginibacillus halophilus]
METNELLAPAKYNITEEIEAYANHTNQAAVHWKSEAGDEYVWTYPELIHRMNQYANVLTAHGLEKGDRVLIIIPRLPEAYALYAACLKAGIIAIPCSEMLRAKDLIYRAVHAEAKAVVAYHTAALEVEEAAKEVEIPLHFTVGESKAGWLALDELAASAANVYAGADTAESDIAFISYTSGTTGQPKGVVHTHGWGYAHIRTAAKNWLDVREGDKVWATAAPGWQKWLWSPFLSTVMLGATAFVYHGKFEPHTYLKLLETEEINVLCCTPTEYRLMAKVDGLKNYNPSALRSTVSAGEPLNRPVIEAFKDAFQVDVRDGYGQTENTLLVGTLTDMTIKPGSMGRPTPGNDVEIINEDGEPVQTGEIGDIAVHKTAPALFQYYYRDPERTKATFRGDWYLTGDLASKDEDGYFWFEGRSDDIIISSGYTIGPFEVEDALTKHDAVKECAVVAAPDEVRGNIVKAFVVLQDGYENEDEEALTKDLQTHTKALTAPYKYPRKIEYIQELPKTTSGKTRRIELRSRETSTNK